MLKCLCCDKDEFWVDVLNSRSYIGSGGDVVFTPVMTGQTPAPASKIKPLYVHTCKACGFVMTVESVL